MIIRLVYPVLIVLVILLAVLVAPFNRKVRLGFWPRITAGRGLRAAYARRDLSRPLVWFHAASAGELLQAEPVMARLRDDGVQLAVSLSSITATGWLQRLDPWPEVVWAGLLPPDFPGAVAGWMRHLRPAALVHLQADLWPGLVVAPMVPECPRC